MVIVVIAVTGLLSENWHMTKWHLFLTRQHDILEDFPRPAEIVRKSSKTTDVTMSVCTGAFVLAKTGLLNGKSATTYHAAFGRFGMTFPNIELKRGARFVEHGNLATAGGLSSGIDLALRVVERYYGRDVARKTAYNMEYQGEGWMNPRFESNIRDLAHVDSRASVMHGLWNGC
jgi:transcriptional regulator GlxA family with amidase domain